MFDHELVRDGILARCHCGAPIFLEKILAALRPGGFVTYLPVRIGEQVLFIRETDFNPKTMKLCLPLDRLPARGGVEMTTTEEVRAGLQNEKSA